MKTNKSTMTQPELLVDDHHGIYCGKFAYEYLNDFYKAQAKKQLSQETINDLLNIDSEFHHDAVDSFMNCTYKTPTGQKFSIQFADGGVWIIPNCFARSKAANDFFGN